MSDPKTEKQYETLVKWSLQQQIIKEHIMPDFPFGPIPHWIDPNDKLPEINQEVLTWCENIYSGPKASYPLGHKYFALDKYLDVGFRTDLLGYGKVLEWMPLPPPPEEK